MTSGSFLRAFYLQDTAAMLSRAAPTVMARAQTALPPAAFEARSRSAWIPAEWSLQLDGLILEELGEIAVVELYRTMTARSAALPYYAPVWRMATKLMGNGPWAILQWMPTTYRLTTKNLGVVTCTRSSTGCTLVMHNIPSWFSQAPCNEPRTQGAMLGLIDMFGLDGHVACETTATSSTCHVRWWPIAKARPSRAAEPPS